MSTLWRFTGYVPLVICKLIANPVVKAAVAALPEFKFCGDYAVSAPIGGKGDFLSLKFFLQPLKFLFQVFPVRYGFALF
jgi:hypothetical protein